MVLLFSALSCYIIISTWLSIFILWFWVLQIFFIMFIRKVRNRRGRLSVQAIQMFRRSYNVVKTIGCATTQHEIERLEQLAREEIERLSGNQLKLCSYESNEIIEQTFSILVNSSIRSVGLELILARSTIILGLMPSRRSCTGTWS